MGFFSNKDKAGSTSGGSSTGRDGYKRGGSSGSADPNTQTNRGVRTCGTCHGSGQVAVPRYETISHTDDDGKIVETEHYSGEDYKTCKKCKGTGER